MKYDNLNAEHFNSLKDIPVDFEGMFGIPRGCLMEFYENYPTYWEEFEHRGTVVKGKLKINDEPMPAIVLFQRKNTSENP